MSLATGANIVLIGLRGSGKTTVGRLLAKRLGRVFVDLDEVTPRELGEENVASALKKHGEPAFRSAEARALGRALSVRGRVVSLGGGTPTAPGASDFLVKERDAGWAVVVYLHAEASVLRGRLAGTDNSQRPSLTGRPVLDEIEVLFERRDGLYRSIASVVVEVGTDTPEATRDEVLRVAEA